jgi:hypothetical protein
VITEAYGVFVAPTGNDTSGDGSRMRPYATIGHAISEAAGKRVYACGSGGSYGENLVVSRSVSAYGGLNCSTWTYDGSKATVAPMDAGYALQVTGSGATFEDFAFQSRPGVGAGASSIAVFLNGATSTTLRSCTVSAGPAVQGQDQSTPTPPYSGAAPPGIAARIGTSSSPGAPGPAVLNPICTTAANGDAGTGGLGGGFPGSSSGHDGLIGPTNGTQCPMSGCNACVQAGDGLPGGAGSDGVGAQTWAAFTSSGWLPAQGQPGGIGGIGQGGGGGGYANLGVGIWGDSGGAGGCGGPGGASGTGGGSSIAVLILGSSAGIDLDTCTLQPSGAGRGGNGASGAAGQQGGAKSENTHCAGGAGGNGGNGGAGGGGAGGVSAGVVWSGAAAPTMTGTNVANLPTPAAGGLDGYLSTRNGGKAGVAQAVVAY